MDITIELTGKTSLIMHNPRLVDPDYPITREIAALTGKRKKTDDDRAKIEMLEWFGGIYDENNRIVLPTANIRKCLIETARINKLGKHVERALVMLDMVVPLIHDGPDDPKDIFATGNGFIFRTSVVVSRRRIMKTRPKFLPWKVEVPALLLDDAGLNYDELERITHLAGRATGIGDARTLGFGRFDGVIKQR